MNRERPRGVTLLAIYFALAGAGIVAVTAYAIYVLRTIPRALGDFVYFPEVLLVIAALVAAVHALASYGLWTLRPWARFLAIAFALLGIAIGMLALPLGVIAVVVNVGNVWYLRDPRVAGLFRPPHPTPPWADAPGRSPP